MEVSMLKKFVDDGTGDCVHCHERRYDCRCDEFSAAAAGFVFDCKNRCYRRGAEVFLSGAALVDYFNGLETAATPQPHYNVVGSFKLSNGARLAVMREQGQRWLLRVGYGDNELVTAMPARDVLQEFFARPAMKRVTLRTADGGCELSGHMMSGESAVCAVWGREDDECGNLRSVSAVSALAALFVTDLEDNQLLLACDGGWCVVTKAPDGGLSAAVVDTQGVSGVRRIHVNGFRKVCTAGHHRLTICAAKDSKLYLKTQELAGVAQWLCLDDLA
jgi:hypothetical protein